MSGATNIRDAKLDLKQIQEAISKLPPVCPHCGMEPFVPIGHLCMIKADAIMERSPIMNTSVIRCGNPKCRKVVTVVVIGVQEAPLVDLATEREMPPPPNANS